MMRDSQDVKSLWTPMVVLRPRRWSVFWQRSDKSRSFCRLCSAVSRKNIVAAGLAEKCTLQLSYAIGVSQPLSIYIDTFGTGTVRSDIIAKAVARSMDLSPRGIREHLQLNKSIYQRTAAYGHFGREPDLDGGFSWEKINLVDSLTVRACEPIIRRYKKNANLMREDLYGILPSGLNRFQ